MISENFHCSYCRCKVVLTVRQEPEKSNAMRRIGDGIQDYTLEVFHCLPFDLYNSNDRNQLSSDITDINCLRILRYFVITITKTLQISNSVFLGIFLAISQTQNFFVYIVLDWRVPDMAWAEWA